MVGKKGYLRILESMFALVITFSFILYIMPSDEIELKDKSGKYLLSLINNNDFRINAMNLTVCEEKGNNETIVNILTNSMLPTYNFIVCGGSENPTLPRKKVFAESIYLTGNITDFTMKKIIRLYYWS